MFFNIKKLKGQKEEKILNKRYKELESEKDKMESIIMNLINGIIFFDLKGNIKMMNPSAKKLFALEKGGIKEFKKILSAMKDKNLSSTLLNGFSDKDVVRKKTIAFKNLILEVTTVRIVDSKGNLIGYIKNIHDVTREKEIDTMKSEFISIAAHQLRTPLTGIKWVMETILKDYEKALPDDGKDLLEKGTKSTERIIRLINDLLNVSRIEEGLFGLVFQVSSMETLLDEILLNINELIKKKNINIKVIKPGAMPQVRMDREKMGLALTNILDNALKYTPEYGDIEVKIKVLKNELNLSVKDDGVGIPKEEQDRIFSKFFRGSNVIRMQTEGTGLGLFIVKNIIESHGGKIKIKSREKKGTEVIFILPLKT